MRRILICATLLLTGCSEPDIEVPVEQSPSVEDKVVEPVNKSQPVVEYDPWDDYIPVFIP